MPNAAVPTDRSWLAPALALVGAITAARIVLLYFARADLFVDEAQYWLWGQAPAFGYYSKPPLIAWVIGAATWAAGSDSAFAIRLPAPLFHAATALILAGIAARLHGPRTAPVVAAAYATLPMVTVGSLLISTDTIMFPFLAGALAIYLRLVAPGGGGRPHLAALAGLLLGLAFLAKYAALYYLVLGGLAALDPRLRPDRRDGAALVAAFALVAAPNVIWNLMNGFTTLSHTVDNTGWRGGVAAEPARMARFLGEQFLVFGPVLFPALILAALRRDGGSRARLLVMLSLPVVALVALQALISGANANWTVAAYLSGTLIAVPFLMARWRGWLIASFAINGALALALPLAATRADTLRFGERLLLARYVGLRDLSETIIRLGKQEHGVTVFIAAERAVLADLFHAGRDAGIEVFAWPRDGTPRNHYEQRYPYAGTAAGPVMAVARGDSAPPPCAALASGRIEPGPGAYEGRRFAWWIVPAACWGAR